jgi:exopolysaccharide biosynthesis polyprenyl glycosylphosphotransferase
LRFQTFSELRPVIYAIPFAQYLEYVLAASLFTLFIFALSGLYHIGPQRIPREMQRIFMACSTSVLGLIVFIFFRHELFTSRFIVLAAWILGIFFVLMGRLLLRFVRYLCFSSGRGLHPIAVIGSGRIAREFVRMIHATPSLGLSIAATHEVFDEGAKANLARLIATQSLDEIFVMDAQVARESLSKILDFVQLHHIGIRYAADFIGGSNLEVSMICGIPIVKLKKTKLDGWWRIMKRIFDCVTACILLIPILPLMAVIACAIRLNSRGPAIYKNVRVGQRGNFVTYKFRSMYIEDCTGIEYDPTGSAERTEEQLAREQSARRGPVYKVLNDPRRTSVGRFLERTSLDELPQLWNVVLGNMSLVGPRPHMPNQVAGYQLSHHKVFNVKPGVTGLAQISGRSDLDFDDEASLDIFYIENWSFFLDCIILFKTPFSILMRKSGV